METTGEGWDLPPDTASWSDWTWFHIKPGRARRLVILSEQPLWYQGHFVSKRMAPCIGHECVECMRGTGQQVRWVFAAAEIESRRQGLVEVGNATALELKQFTARVGTFRGMMIWIGRYSLSKQSRIEVELVDEPMPVWAAEMEGTDLKRALQATWLKAGFSLPQQAGSGQTRRAVGEPERHAPPSLEVILPATRKVG